MPSGGPVLLVGNHPNSLLDPLCVAWAARRPLRFLAKAPLFSHPVVGWLVRGAGAIPVYRKADDPTQMSHNEESFRAVHDALAAGSAVALFPEGISHSQPSLAPLKTGAARIALGAAPRAGGAFPIIPVGLVFRIKDRFRSAAHAAVGAPVAWDDLAARGPDDHDAVRELTDRIDRAMRAVTLNLARWEDERVVITAEAIWAARRAVSATPAARVSRIATAADLLARARASGDERWTRLARDVSDHARLLRALGVRPADVELDTGFGTAARWALRRLTIVGALQLLLAAIALILFWIPYRVTGAVVARMANERDLVSTYRVLGGAMILIVWIALLAIAAGFIAGRVAAVASFLLLPFVAIAGLHAAEQWRWTLATARRWFLMRRGDPRIAALRERQHELARRLDEALAAHGQL